MFVFDEALVGQGIHARAETIQSVVRPQLSSCSWF